MKRREFVKYTVVGVGALSGIASAQETEYEDTEWDDDDWEDCQSFGYYEGISPGGQRSPSRNDGTTYMMPCISKEDIEAGEEQTYDFWHGHGARHTFTITDDDFQTLKDEGTVEVLTSVVGGHRHAVRVSLDEGCG